MSVGQLAQEQPSNPFDGVVPDFGVFGVEFTSAWQKLLGGVWALVFVAIAFLFLSAAVQFASARKNGYEQGVTENAKQMKQTGAAALVVAAAPLLFGAILAATS